MDEKENIIKYYIKTGEKLTNLTGFSFDTRVGATANAFVLLKFSIKEPLQLQQRMLRLRQPSGCCPYR